MMVQGQRGNWRQAESLCCHTILAADVRTPDGRSPALMCVKGALRKTTEPTGKTFWSIQERGFTTSCFWLVTFPEIGRKIECRCLWRIVTFCHGCAAAWTFWHCGWGSARER